MSDTIIRCVLWDLDGTLVDSYEAITFALNAVLEELGLPTRTREEVHGLVGGGVHAVLRKAAGEENEEEGVRRFRHHYRDVVLEKTRLMPGARATIDELHRRGYHQGVGTNKPSDFSRRIIDHFGLRPQIGSVIGPDDVERPKPAPDILERLCADLDVEAGETAYVGDMPLDAEAARAAGTAVWLLPTGSASAEEVREARPDRIFERLEDCLEPLPPLVDRARS